jgi:DNA-binding transcriptional ArsR family regulator
MTQLFWDCGTAYDMFVSLMVLHEPEDYEVRGAWAAGVRARIPVAERATLEALHLTGANPLNWVYSLPEPKDGTTVLWALGRVPAAERLAALSLNLEWPPAHIAEILRGVSARGAWSEREWDALRAFYRRKSREKGEAKEPTARPLTDMLDMWAHPVEAGERILQALRTYQEVFFAEEERRIRPALEAALARAQELAQRLAVPDLLEELSQGLRWQEMAAAEELVLGPSYWCTPLIHFGTLSDQRKIGLFGARPPEASLIPGETVPDALLRALKALSDPTRLAILRYVARESLTPAELSRRLRLRIPTVTHHLGILRLAGLVRLIIEDEEETNYYAARPEAIAAAFEALQSLLQGDPSQAGGGVPAARH